MSTKRGSAAIGIVACSAEGAALCYRAICQEAALWMGTHDHPQISLHGHSLAAYMECIERADWPGIADLMLSSAEKLRAGGAEFLICPDNTIHRAWSFLVARSPLPWLHIAEEVADEAQRQGFTRLGILGTKYTMEGPVYPGVLERHGIEYAIPSEVDRAIVNTVIFEELVRGDVNVRSLTRFREIIERLKSNGCDAVVLGCTEIPLLVGPQQSPLPTLDSTRILARAALRRSLAALPAADGSITLAGLSQVS